MVDSRLSYFTTTYNNSSTSPLDKNRGLVLPVKIASLRWYQVYAKQNVCINILFLDLFLHFIMKTIK